MTIDHDTYCPVRAFGDYWPEVQYQYRCTTVPAVLRFALTLLGAWFGGLAHPVTVCAALRSGRYRL